MKRILGVALCLILSVTALAGPGKTEITAGYGIATFQDFAELNKVLLIAIFSGLGSGVVDAVLGLEPADKYDGSDIQGFGAFCLGVYRNPNIRWRYGVLLTYSRYEVTHHFMLENKAKDRDQFFGVMARADYHWMRRRAFALYSGLALGGCLYTSKGEASGVEGASTTLLFPAPHFNLLGFRLGGGLAFYTEFGMGCSGVWNSGLSYRW